MTNSMALSTVIDTSNIVNGQEGTKAEGNILDRFNKNLNKTSDYYYDNSAKMIMSILEQCFISHIY